MKAIYKYPIGFGVNEIIIPSNWKIVKFDKQNGNLFFWALIDTNYDKVKVNFAIYGTGHPIPKENIYIGTCFDNEFVWHLFMVKK